MLLKYLETPRVGAVLTTGLGYGLEVTLVLLSALGYLC